MKKSIKNILLVCVAVVALSGCRNPFTPLYVPDPIHSIKEDQRILKNGDIHNAKFSNSDKTFNLSDVDISNIIIKDNTVIKGIIIKSKNPIHINKNIVSGLIMKGTIERMPIVYDDTSIIKEGDEDNQYNVIEITDIDHSSTDRKKIYRLVSKSILISNRSCDRYVTNLLSNVSTNNTVNGFLSLGLTVASAMTNHVKTSTDLAIGATGVTASGAVLNKEVLFDQVVPIIIQVIKEARKNKETRIMNLVNDKTKSYTIGAALNDINDYHIMCSLTGGLISLKEDIKALNNSNPLDILNVKLNNSSETTYLEEKIEKIDLMITSASTEEKVELNEIKKDLLKKWKLLIKSSTSDSNTENKDKNPSWLL